MRRWHRQTAAGRSRVNEPPRYEHVHNSWLVWQRRQWHAAVCCHSYRFGNHATARHPYVDAHLTMLSPYVQLPDR